MIILRLCIFNFLVFFELALNVPGYVQYKDLIEKSKILPEIKQTLDQFHIKTSQTMGSNKKTTILTFLT